MGGAGCGAAGDAHRAAGALAQASAGDGGAALGSYPQKNIASLAGFAPGGSGHTTYAAIKSALIKFSQSLHAELEGGGVHCTAVCPGLTYSEFHDVNRTRERVKLAPARFWQTAEEVAEAGYYASEHNRAVVVTGAANKLLAGLAKITPDPLAMEITKSLQAKYRGNAD